MKIKLYYDTMNLERCDMMVKNEKSSMKNIIIIILFILSAVLLTLYFYKWYQVKQDGKYIESYLISSNTISLEMTEIEEIKTVLSETPSYYFVYIGYAKDKKVYDFEKELKPLITDYDIQNNFYYLNITDIKEKEKNYKESIAKELDINKNKIEDIPVILFFKDGKLVQDGVTNAEDFEQLLNDNDIKEK